MINASRATLDLAAELEIHSARPGLAEGLAQGKLPLKALGIHSPKHSVQLSAIYAKFTTN